MGPFKSRQDTDNLLMRHRIYDRLSRRTPGCVVLLAVVLKPFEDVMTVKVVANIGTRRSTTLFRYRSTIQERGKCAVGYLR